MKKYINISITILEKDEKLVCVDCGKYSKILIDHDYCPDCYHTKAINDIDASR